MQVCGQSTSVSLLYDKSEAGAFFVAECFFRACWRQQTPSLFILQNALQIFKSLKNVNSMRIYFAEQDSTHFLVVQFDCKPCKSAPLSVRNDTDSGMRSFITLYDYSGMLSPLTMVTDDSSGVASALQPLPSKLLECAAVTRTHSLYFEDNEIFQVCNIRACMCGSTRVVEKHRRSDVERCQCPNACMNARV